jgi:replicative DNA helicase
MNGDEVFTGLDGLDSVLGGYRQRTLNVIAGRPGMGKTALALDIARNVAESYGEPVLYFSLRLSRARLLERLIKASFDENKFPLACESVESMLRDIAGLKIYIDPHRGITTSYMRDRVAEIRSGASEVKLVIIDDFDLISLSDRDCRHVEEGDRAVISRQLKEFALEFGVPIVVLANICRGVDLRPDHVPVLSDMRDLLGLSDDADSVVLIHRPDYYNTFTGDRALLSDAQIIVAKNRYGESKVSVKVKWNRDTLRFCDEVREKEKEVEAAFRKALWKQDREKYFEFFERPVKFCDFFKYQEYECVDMYELRIVNSVPRIQMRDFFRWKNGTIESYNNRTHQDDMPVYGYNCYVDPRSGKETLEILVGDEW